MIEAAWIATAISALDYLRKKHQSDNETGEKLGELQDALYRLREENLRLQGESQDLREQVQKHDTWEETLSRYELVTTPGTATVYKFKGEPEHYACPACIVAKREIHILQDLVGGHFECPRCQQKFRVSPRNRWDRPGVDATRDQS